MVELRDLKGDLARSRADADAVKEQVAHHKERLAQLEENIDKCGVPHTPEAADQKVQLGKSDENLDRIPPS
jgi:transcription elongation GreA/GreB family factor